MRQGTRTRAQHESVLRKPIAVALLFCAVLAGSMAQAQTVASSHDPLLANSWPCNSDAQKPGFLPTRTPTLVGMMVSRYESLVCTMQGYQKSGMPMVGIYEAEFTPAEYADDAGIYLVIPWISRHTGLSLRRSIDVFLLGMILAAALSGIAGFVALGRHALTVAVTVIGIVLLSIVCVVAGDIYILLAAVPIAFVPWVLRLARPGAGPRAMWVVLPLLGLVAGAADLIRSHAGTATVIFTVLLLVLGAGERRWKCMAGIAVLLVMMAIPSWYFQRVIHRRDQFLRAHVVGFTPGQTTHPFWHSVYIGFGYLNNDLVPKYSDTVAAEKVESIAPGTVFVSPQYEAILRHQVWILAREHPMLVLDTLFAKLGVIAAMILAYANFGLWAAWRRPKYFVVEVAFWAAIAFDSLFGLLVMPRASYLLGMIAFAALYGMASIHHALCGSMWAPAERRPESPVEAARRPEALRGVESLTGARTV